MLDVKKLITGFLILALGASMSAWILSNTNGSKGAGTLGVSGVNQNAAISSLGNNAFYPLGNTDILLPSTETATSTNLTDSVADAFVNGIVSANPDGPQKDMDGGAIFVTPDDQTLADALQNEPAFQNPNIAIPDWDKEVVDMQGKIKIVSYSSTTVTDYITGFNNAINNQLVKTGLSTMAQNNGSLPADESSVIATGESAASNMLSSALNFPTPAPLVNFQKSFIKLLVYERDLARLVQNNSQDPAMASAILQAKESDYQAAVWEFDAQAQKLSSSLSAYGGAQGGAGGLLSFVNAIFSINKAQATGIPVTDWLEKLMTSIGISAAHADAWATYLSKVAQDMALQIVKNTLMALIQKKVLAYIQNSGAPRFITNWGTEMVNAAEMSALNAIDSNFSCINANTIFPRIQVVLNAIYKPGNNACAAQFQSALSSGNLTNFYNNFSNGGFVTFGQTLMPSNDFYGGLFFTAQNAGQAAQQSNSVFGLKTTASQGYRNSQVCPDGSDPNGTHTVCSFVGPLAPGEKCPSQVTVPNNGTCANGAEPSITMPGIINTQAMDKALGGHTQLIAAANSIAGIVQAAAQSLLMGIVNAGVSAATQAVNGALQGDGGIMSIATSSITAPSATSTVAMALSCSPANFILQPGDQTAFFASGGTYDGSGNPPTYTWRSSDGQAGTGMTFDITYNATGTFAVTLNDSQGDAPTTCTATVNDAATATTTMP